METAWYIVGALLVFFLGRETVNHFQKKGLKTELRKKQRALGKEKMKNAKAKTKKTRSRYHDLRDAYGKFRKRD